MHTPNAHERDRAPGRAGRRQSESDTQTAAPLGFFADPETGNFVSSSSRSDARTL